MDKTTEADASPPPSCHWCDQPATCRTPTADGTLRPACNVHRAGSSIPGVDRQLVDTPKRKPETITDRAREAVGKYTEHGGPAGGRALSESLAVACAVLAIEALDRIGTQLGEVAGQLESIATTLDQANRAGWGDRS
jgi:hypothetical protein